MKQNTYTKIDANASTDSFYGRSYPAEAPSQYKVSLLNFVSQQ